MAYSTVAEVREVLKGYVESGPEDPDVTPTLLTDGQIEYEIRNADGEIDAILRRRYVLPLPLPFPEILKNLSIDIAAAQTDLIFRGAREYASELSPFRLRYERALRILDRISTGDYPLYNDGEGPDTSGDQAIVINPAYDQEGFLKFRETFPRGAVGLGVDGDVAEYAVRPIPPRPWVGGEV